MIFYILAYLGGALTLLAPCVLPVLPFVFARAHRPFMTSGLPLLGGMAVTFAAVATLAAVAGNWAVQANQYGRLAALALLALMGLALIAPRWAERLSRPNVKHALKDLGIAFPVAVDNNFAIWSAFNNNYWPAHYFVDAQGRIRFHHFGEGEYEKSEQVIQQLLEEARKQAKPA